MLVYDFTTRIWRDMHQAAGWPSWTHDSKEIQVEQDNVIVRVRVSDGRITPVINLQGIRRVNMEGGAQWVGLGPDESPVILREVSSPPELYAFTVEWP